MDFEEIGALKTRESQRESLLLRAKAHQGGKHDLEPSSPLRREPEPRGQRVLEERIRTSKIRAT